VADQAVRHSAQTARRRLLSTQSLLWLIGIAFVLHEAEEWNLVGWMTTHFEPAPRFADREARTLLVLFSLLGISFTAVALRFLSQRAALFALLPLFVGVLLGNALTHVYWLFLFGTYAPGVLSSAFLLLPLIGVLVHRVLRERLVPAVFVWVLLALALLQPVGAAVAGSTLAGPQLALQGFGARLGGWLFGPG